MSKNKCRYRVWDNGDKTDCGLPVLTKGPYCPEHVIKCLELRVYYLEEAIKDFIDKLKELVI